jgi:HAD superfamily hydrolase (TIGR01484 family)
MEFECAVFDIDGTLCEEGKNVMESSIQALKKLEEKKIKIVYASGKHPWYITGGLRFSGLLRNDTIVIGENGGNIFFPNEKGAHLYSKYIKDIEVIRKDFYKKYPDLIFEDTVLWEEPKSTIFTLFPENKKVIFSLENFLKEIIKKRNLNLYTLSHKDAVDVVQNGLNKAYALIYLEKNNYINIKKTVAFGDGMNDYEILKEVGFPVTVSNADENIKDLVAGRGGYVSEKTYGEGVLDAVKFLLGE